MEDLVHIQVIDKKTINVNPNNEEIKRYWEENKDIYQTERGYEISSVFIPLDSVKIQESNLKSYYEDFKNQFLDSEGQIIPYEKAREQVSEKYKDAQAQKEALKEYIALRKNENPKAENLIIYEGNGDYGAEFINLLSQAKDQETLKPIKITKDKKSGYITAKITKIIPSKPKPYEAAQANAREDFVNAEKVRLLEEKATQSLESFKGVDVGYVGYGETKALKGLTKEESQEFIQELMNRKEEKGYILLGNKAILYKIFDQRVKNSAIISQNLDFLIQNGVQIKARMVEKEFLDYLSKTYKIVRKI